MRYLTAGESHGKAMCGILDGCPAGVACPKTDIVKLLSKRWSFYGRSKRGLVEKDRVEVLSGVENGLTTGAPISIIIFNSARKTEVADTSAEERRRLPRPGHADLPGATKYGHKDAMTARERASARDTVIRTALSVPPRNLLKAAGIRSAAFVTKLGGIRARKCNPLDADKRKLLDHPENFFLSLDQDVFPLWKALIDKAQADKQSLGGIAEVAVWGVPPGLGSYTQWDQRLDSLLSAALMAIPGVKAVELGEGIGQAGLIGSAAHDRILFSEKRGFHRSTNLAGGLEGGVTNGEPLLIRLFMKPPPGSCSTETVDLHTGIPQTLPPDRGDTAAVAPMAIAAESAALIVIAAALTAKFGQDTLDQILNSLRNYNRHG